MKQEYDRPREGDLCTTILPGGVDLCVDRDVCTVRADVTVDRVRTVTIWGCVTDCDGMPVSGVPVKLLKYMGCELKEVACTCTDCKGRYRFELRDASEGRYRVEVCQGSCPGECPYERSDSCPERGESPCAPRCPEPSGCAVCLCRGSSSGGCRSISRSNVQYY